MRINKDLVEERAALVQTLRDYAVGKMADHDAALAASRGLRTNVMTEVCVLHCRAPGFLHHLPTFQLHPDPFWRTFST